MSKNCWEIFFRIALGGQLSVTWISTFFGVVIVTRFAMCVDFSRQQTPYSRTLDLDELARESPVVQVN